jgi:hypothetical protein
MSRPMDTSAEADRVYFELLGRMTPQEKLQRAVDLTLAVQRVAFEGLRLRYPNATDDEIWLRLAARRLGREKVLEIYGFDAGDE